MVYLFNLQASLSNLEPFPKIISLLRCPCEEGVPGLLGGDGSAYKAPTACAIERHEKDFRRGAGRVS